MNLFYRFIIALVALIAWSGSLPAAAGESSPAVVKIVVDPRADLGPVSPTAEGLSYESYVLRPDSAGKHYFDPQNVQLVRLFHTLGINSLRLGGVTVDLPRTVISRDDIDVLFKFARAADVKVIYSFRLQNGDVEAIKPLAMHIVDTYSANLDCVAIGNEPNEYFASYAAFAPAWTPFFTTLAEQCPKLSFCGPCAWKEDWARQFSEKIGDEVAVRIAFVAQHEYPFGPSTRVTDPAAARRKMLTAADYDKWYQGFVPAVRKRGLRYRIEEASNYSKGGAADVSDTYAAALWGLDYLYWWNSHQALGVNFHTGDRQNYSAFKTAPGGYSIRPLAYGLLAFSLGGHGRFISATRPADDVTPLDIRSYATIAPSGEISLTIINRSFDTTAREAAVTVRLPAGSSLSRAEACYLRTPTGDVAAKSGITIGEAEIEGDGIWKGHWTPVAAPSVANQFQVSAPPASAVIVRFLK